MIDLALAWPNRIDSAMLASSTTWQPTLPLSNLQTREYAQVARTTGATSLTITASLTRLRKIGAFAVVNHNLSVTATVQFKAYYGADNTSTLVWDSGVLAAWPVNHDQSLLVFEDVDFWEAKISNEEREYYTKLATWFAPDNLAARFFEIIITDPDNPDGYVQLGRLFISGWWQPTVAPEYGDIEHNIVDPSEMQIVPETGTRYYRKLKKYRTTRISWKHLTLQEAWHGLNDAQRFEGTTGEMLFAATKDRTDENFFALCYLCQFESNDLLSLAYFDTSSGSYAFQGSVNLREIL